MKIKMNKFLLTLKYFLQQKWEECIGPIAGILTGLLILIVIGLIIFFVPIVLWILFSLVCVFLIFSILYIIYDWLKENWERAASRAEEVLEKC